MTRFQDARDKYFQDVERNKACSTQIVMLQSSKFLFIYIYSIKRVAVSHSLLILLIVFFLF